MQTVDFETRSACDIKRHGLPRYATDPTTTALCLAYGKHLWVRGKPAPPVSGPVRAHNAAFERWMWKCMKWEEIPLELWHCTLAQARHANVPGTLEKAAAFMKCGNQKDMEGHKIMMKLCKPDKNGNFNEDPKLHRRNEEYCVQDVNTEEELAQALPPLTDREQKVWELDRVINERGLPVDVDFCRGAVSLVEQIQERGKAELPELTRGTDGESMVQSATQVSKILDWVQRKGLKVTDLRKETIDLALEGTFGDLPEDVQRVLEIRQIGAPAAVKKYQSALDRISIDSRIREQFLYYGAATGRWSGSGVQFHNLKRQLYNVPQWTIDAISGGDYETFALLSGRPMADLQNAVRQMVCAGPGKTLVISDFAAIEARVLHWVARSPGVQVFRNFDAGKGEEPYKIEAGKIFGVDPSKVDKQQRQLGKVAVLGLGYGMGGAKYVGTVKSWTRMDIELDFANTIVKRWRRANPAITLFWRQLETSFIAVANGASFRKLPGNVSFSHWKDAIVMTLPSGRQLFYWGVQISKEGKISILDNRGTRVHIWGGHLAENCVQAIARDLMVDAMLRCEKVGLPVVMHVHDEVVLEVALDAANDAKDFLGRAMRQTEEWSKGCPVEATALCSKRLAKE